MSKGRKWLVCLAFAALFGAATATMLSGAGATARAAGAAQIGTEWTVHEAAADMTVSDVRAGGVGTVSYNTILTEGQAVEKDGETDLYRLLDVYCLSDGTQVFAQTKADGSGGIFFTPAFGSAENPYPEDAAVTACYRAPNGVGYTDSYGRPVTVNDVYDPVVVKKEDGLYYYRGSDTQVEEIYQPVVRQSLTGIPAGGAGGYHIYNSVVIPVTGYGVSLDRVSIKYRTTLDVSGQNVTLYMLLDEGFDAETGEFYDKSEVLSGWFVNWNVTTGKAPDGESYVTVNHKEYAKERTVVGIRVQFDCPPKSDGAKFEFLGITFHGSAETPSFVTDPSPAVIGEATAAGTGYTVTAGEDGACIEVSAGASGGIEFSVARFTELKNDRFYLDVTAETAVSLSVWADTRKLGDYTLTPGRLTIEAQAGEGEVSVLRLTAADACRFTVHSVEAARAPAVTNYATSNTGFFTAYEEISDGPYQMRMTRNNSAGFPKITVSVDSYKPVYDVIAVDVEVLSGLTLLGLTTSPEKYLMSHWSKTSFLAEGRHELTFFYFLGADPAWDGRTLTMYVNPNSIADDGKKYDYASDFKIGISFLRSSDLKTPTLTTEKDSYVYDYDGQKKEVSAVVQPGTLNVSASYRKEGGSVSAVAPSAAGSYAVTLTAAGNREYKQISKDVTLVINKVNQSVPAAGVLTFDYEARTVSFDAAVYEVNFDQSFGAETEISDGSVLTVSAPLYVRRRGTANYYPSEAVAIQVPGIPAPIASFEAVKVTKTSVEVTAAEGAQYRLVKADGTANEWKDTPVFTGLTAGTEYIFEARIKATETSFAGEIVRVTVRTEASATGGETKPAEESKGRGWVVALTVSCGAAAVLAAVAATVVLIRKKRSAKRPR